jgi:hypothetical protein
MRDLDKVEEEIKNCLLELVKVNDAGPIEDKTNRSGDNSTANEQNTISVMPTVFVPLIKL